MFEPGAPGIGLDNKYILKDSDRDLVKTDKDIPVTHNQLLRS